MDLSTPSSSSPFSETYKEAREKYLVASNAAIAVLGGSLTSRVLPDVKGSEGEDLALDYTILGDETEQCTSLYLLTAGQHGVEGYLGSAVQIALLDSLREKSQQLPAGCWIVFVHVMNPFGMSWWRRWNEENCDLNRNFLPDGNTHLPQVRLDVSS